MTDTFGKGTQANHALQTPANTAGAPAWIPSPSTHRVRALTCLCSQNRRVVEPAVRSEGLRKGHEGTVLGDPEQCHPCRQGPSGRFVTMSFQCLPSTCKDSMPGLVLKARGAYQED